MSPSAPSHEPAVSEPAAPRPTVPVGDGAAGAPPAYRQVIPRPAKSRAGHPAPWASLPPSRRRGIGLAAVRRAVEVRGARGPAEVSDELLRSLPGVTTPGAPAAVLVPLFEEDGEVRVVLTVRSDRLRSHRGEVAFPGGRIDGGEGVVHAALREAEEEIGLSPSQVEVVGQLTAMPTATSRAMVSPVVGLLGARAGAINSPDEVDRVFDVSLADLVADGVFHEELWSPSADHPLHTDEFPVWFFEVAGELVWGVTARILVELTCLVLGLPDPLRR